MPDFKDMLKYFRTRENLSQSELAKHIGVSTSTISMYEAGNREPDFETEEKIADFFNTDLNTLRGRDIESQLMDFDVPRERKPIDYFVQTSDFNILVETKHFNKDAQYEQLNRFLHCIYKLNQEGARKVLDYASDLAQNPKYTSASPDILQAAHERTDIEVTDEMRKHDDDIMSSDDF